MSSNGTESTEVPDEELSRNPVKAAIQWALLHVMNRIFDEEYYNFPWEDCAEFNLWEEALKAKRGAPNANTRGNHLEHMSRLADGWWTWNEEKQETHFLSLAEWEAVYAARRKLV